MFQMRYRPSPADGRDESDNDELADTFEDMIQVLEEVNALPIDVVDHQVEQAIKIRNSDHDQSRKRSEFCLLS
jgi:hypothetical protein